MCDKLMNETEEEVDTKPYTEQVTNQKQTHKKYKRKTRKKKSIQENDPLLRKSLSVYSKSSKRTSLEVSIGVAEDNNYDWTQSYLSHKRNVSMSTQRYKHELIKSFRRYTTYNGCKFVIITLIIIGIAVDRQLALQKHYKNKSQCCFCYGAASQNTDTIFEWQTCEYANKIKNVHKECHWSSQKLTNLSTRYTRFHGGKWYFVVTAIIAFVVAFLYATTTVCVSRTSGDIDILLRKMPLEFMLSYNIIISMICFYQILIDYQYYAEQYTYDNDNKKCYVDALSRPAENYMFIILITAIVYTFSPCIIVFPIHFCKNHCRKCKIFGMVEVIYNVIIFGMCGVITTLFLVVLIFYTFVLLLPKFEWSVWILVITVEIGLLTSFIDIYFFEIFKYSRNPFMNILKIGCCCCYKLCCYKNEKTKSTYFEQFRTHSISEF